MNDLDIGVEFAEMVFGDTLSGKESASDAQAGPPFLTCAGIEQATLKVPVSGQALVMRSELRSDRTGRPYVAITLRLADMALIEARWWQFPYEKSQCPTEGSVYHFTGCADHFNGCMQLRVLDAQLMPEADMSAFEVAISRPFHELIAELEHTIAQLDEPLASLIRSVLSGETHARFCAWPAAQRHHGAARHGLLSHSLRVARLAVSLAEIYDAERFRYDRALVIAGALLHDVGKIHTLPAVAGAPLPTDAAYFDHVTLGILVVKSAVEGLSIPMSTERVNALLHVILAHHGRAEWGASVEPQTVEAWLVHLADQVERPSLEVTSAPASSAVRSYHLKIRWHCCARLRALGQDAARGTGTGGRSPR